MLPLIRAYRYRLLSAYSIVFLLGLSPNLNAQNNATLILPQLDSFIQESRALTGQREFEAAFALNARAFALSKECCGEESAAYAAACFNEGRIHHIKGDYRTAVEWYVPSMRIRKRVLGDLHEDYGKSLNNLAVAYKKLGRFESAEPLYKGALRVRRELFGEQSAPFAATLGNLALLYRELGNYEDAETLNLRALAIREEVLGKDHPHYIRNLLNLGAFYYAIDQLNKAENYYLQVKDFYKTNGETNDMDYLKALDNLGSVYIAKREFELAETYYSLSLQKTEEYLGTEHEFYAVLHNHLGLLYLETNAFDKGQYHFTKALNLLESLDMKNHYWYGFYQQNLGELFYRRGNYQEAKVLQRKSLNVILQSLGQHHRRYREGLREFARTEMALGELPQAAKDLRTLAEISRLPLQNAVRHLSETEMSQYAEDFQPNLAYYFGLAAKLPELADLCFDEILLYRGFLLNRALRINHFSPNDSLKQQQLIQLRAVHRLLAAQYAAPSDDHLQLKDLEEEAEQLEKELAKGIARLEDAEASINWETVQMALKTNEAIIEFVSYTDHLSKNKPEQLAALLLTPNLESPRFIPLCLAKEIDQLIQYTGSHEEGHLNDLYTHAGKGGELYDLIWQPLMQQLSNFPEINSIYLVKVGNLHRLNLGALPSPDGVPVNNTIRISLQTSSRELLLQKRETIATQGINAVLFGAIDYDDISQSQSISEFSSPAGMSRGIRFSGDPSLTNSPWRPLPWTEVEIINAQDQLEQAGFKATSLTLNRATESFFKSIGNPIDNIKSPHLIHLATHGYFFPPPERQAIQTKRNIAYSQHPMIRSGLILAGANHAWTNQYQSRTESEDGILTAYEISHLDLSDTELVILSACETGLGDVQTFEGVYGLQRAFQIAGSEYLLMTLWQVSDFETQFFMDLFYRSWLNEKKDIRAAFRAAQQEMRKRYPDPFYWAGFILLE